MGQLHFSSKIKNCISLEGEKGSDRHNSWILVESEDKMKIKQARVQLEDL